MIDSIDGFVSMLVTQSTLVALLSLIVLPASWLLRNAYPGVLLALWALIPLRLVLPADFAFSYSIAELFTQSLPAPVLESYAPLLGPDVELHKFPHFSQVAEEAGNSLIVPVFALWLAGFLFFVFRYQMAHRMLARDLSRAREVSDERSIDLLKKIKQKLGCRREVKLLVSEAFDVSFTTGTLTSYICIPEETFRTSSEADLSAIISHEIVHIRFYDNLLLNVLNILQCVYFFHPSIWIAKKRIIDHRECLTDLSVVKSGIMPNGTYAKLLLNHVAMTKRSGLQTVPGLGSDFLAMKRRIAGIRRSKDFNRHSYKLKAGMFFVMAFAFVVPMQPVTGANLYSNVSEIEFQLPVDGCSVKAGFGLVEHHSATGKVDHNGIDFEAPTGARVKAVANGRIVQIQKATSRKAGFLVVQHTPDLFSRYVFVENIVVEVGDFVSAGTPLGILMAHEMNGRHGELHFELLEDYEAVDPLPYLDTN